MSFVQYNPLYTSWWEWNLKHTSGDMWEASPRFTTSGNLPAIVTQQVLAKDLSNELQSGTGIKMALCTYIATQSQGKSFWKRAPFIA